MPTPPIHQQVKKVHGTAKTVVPIVAALVTLTGAMLQFMDSSQETKTETPPSHTDGATPESAFLMGSVTPKRVRPHHVILTLLKYLLIVSFSLALIGAIVLLWLSGSEVVRAVVVTLLVVAVVWLAIEVVRRK